MVVSQWLIDKSALVRLSASPDSDEWLGRIDRGLVAISTVTRLEVGYSARSAADWSEMVIGTPVGAMIIEYLTPAIEDRSVEVQRLLVQQGHHRAPSIPDLLIAATAELSGRIVLHVDKDFDVIAGVTGQRMERLNGR
ncbi:PIN domain nuclease [Gordonia sp. TBRC 11910]|uniref:Ribonuclease VapC n=1 Tax=Gordonia asplenii TaxID=2725283 RepID=A0A848L586_9ACTN|nr:PIN domain nuclease [Gordonia asplenii]NMO03793.1 PIN domain nuclease [Gordonia asplenii]